MDEIKANTYKNNLFIRAIKRGVQPLLCAGKVFIVVAFFVSLAACGGGPDVAPSPPVDVTPSEPPPLSSLTLLRGVVSGSSENNTLFKNVADGYKQTYWMPESTSGEHISLSDLRGEISAVFVNERYNAISAWRLVNDDSGEVLAEGSKLGKQTIRFPPVRTSKISLMIDAATKLPWIRQFEVYSEAAHKNTDPVRPLKKNLMEVSDSSRKSACKKSTGYQKIYTPIVVEGDFDGGCQTFSIFAGNSNRPRPPVFVTGEGGSISNVIFDDQGGFIDVYGDTDFKNITWLNVGQHGLVVRARARVSISNFEAYGASDKVFSVDSQASIVAKNCTVYRAGKMFREEGGKCYSINVNVDNCLVEDMIDAVFRSDCKSSTFSFTNSTLKNTELVCYPTINKANCTVGSSHILRNGGHELDDKKRVAAEVSGSSSKSGGEYVNASDGDRLTFWSPMEDDSHASIQLRTLTGLVSTVAILSRGYSGAWRLLNDDTGELLDAGSFMGELLIADFSAVLSSKISLVFDDDTTTLKVTEFEVYSPADTDVLDGEGHLEGVDNADDLNESQDPLIVKQKNRRSACTKSTGSQFVTSPIIATDEFDGHCKTFYADFSNFRKENKGSQPSLFRINSGGSLKNVIFGEGRIDESIHVYADTLLTDISWIDFEQNKYYPKKHGGLKVMAPAKVKISNFDAGNTVSQLFELNARGSLEANNCTANGISDFVKQDEFTCNPLEVSIGNCNFGAPSYPSVVSSMCENSKWHIYDSQIEHSKFCAESAENCEATNSTWTPTIVVDK